MKKLMFATALVASVAAFADPTTINVMGFEGYNSSTIGVNGNPEYDEAGVEKTLESDPLRYFYFDGESNSSVVTNVGASTTKRTAYFTSTEAANSKYLALDTEGGTLWRSIETITESPYGLGTTRPVVATGTYLDTLVQFTVTEDDAPTTSASDKLAIWLGVSTNEQGEVTGTNLMVRAGYLDDNGSDSFVTPTDFVLSTAEPIEAGRWYRLTVKAIGDVTACMAKNSENYDAGFMGFEIYLDGVQLAATEATISSAYMEVATGSDEFAWLSQGTDADFITYLESKKVFPSLEGKVSSYALQGVGFQGTGAVDEIVWTEEDLFPAGPSVVDYTFTLTLEANVTGAAVTTNGAAVVFDNNEAKILAGTTVEIAQPTFASGYQLNTITTNGTAVVEPSFPFSITMGEDMTVVISAEQIPATYPAYITDTTDTYITGKYNDWKAGVGCDDATASAYEKQFLLNVDEATTVGETALEITEIKQNATAGWDITVGCSISGVGLTGETGTAHVCNGYLAVSYTDDLTGTWTTENINITAVDATTGTVTVNVNKSGAKFMKVSLKATQETVTP